jgi:hypothetical protein
MVVFMVFTAINMLMGLFETDMPTARMMDVFIHTTMVMYVCWFLCMVNVHLSLMVMEMATVRVMGMVLVCMLICIFIADVAAPWVVYVFMFGFMVMVPAMIFFVSVIDMHFCFAMV